jgi:hypothetical protein
MTIREFLTRRVAVYGLVALGAWAGAALSMTLTEQPWPYAFFVVVLGVVFIAFYRLKCPSCRTALGIVTFQLVSFGKSRSGRVDYCPFCGVSLDQPYEMPK